MKSLVFIALLLGATACSKSEKKPAAENTDAKPDSATPAPKAAPAPPLALRSTLTPQGVTFLKDEAGDKHDPHPFYTAAECSKLGAPGTFASAQGAAKYTYEAATKELRFEITYSGLSGSPIMVHFRKGKDDDAGPIVQTICGRPPPGDVALGFSAPPLVSAECPAGDAGTLKGVYKVAGNDKITPPLTAEEEAKLLGDRGMYVIIATCLNQRGEIRGQINRH